MTKRLVTQVTFVRFLSAVSSAESSMSVMLMVLTTDESSLHMLADVAGQTWHPICLSSDCAAPRKDGGRTRLCPSWRGRPRGTGWWPVHAACRSALAAVSGTTAFELSEHCSVFTLSHALSPASMLRRSLRMNMMTFKRTRHEHRLEFTSLMCLVGLLQVARVWQHLPSSRMSRQCCVCTKLMNITMKPIRQSFCSQLCVSYCSVNVFFKQSTVMWMETTTTTTKQQ